ncbi:MAG: carboxymuconolactone decarboxylase family protein [Sedimentisphaerales bacterium]|nr:carboxymuconolactone decarboxylase family protein [Sedimentisphaerales bacterium]
MKMSQEIKEFFEKFAKDAVKMKEQTPNMINGFGGLFSKVMAEGSITTLEKEFIAVGIAVAANCSHCIRLHVKKCFEAGATRQQILEAASVAVMMGGGPAYTHIPVVIDTLDTLNAE